ncbi:MAG: hypothetical protein H0V82_06905 [Candidatus Protochlamydia sp.]|nr:hypothetical protein [Candidatus Protochlamydia sp.]
MISFKSMAGILIAGLLFCNSMEGKETEDNQKMPLQDKLESKSCQTDALVKQEKPELKPETKPELKPQAKSEKTAEKCETKPPSVPEKVAEKAKPCPKEEPPVRLNKICRICCPCDPFSVFSSISHTEGRGIGYVRGYTSFRSLLVYHPYEAYGFQPFVDIRDHFNFFSKRQGAVNIGGGSRYLSPQLQKVFGMGLYYDYRHYRGDYHQASFNLEMLGYRYDLRFNGYWAINSHSTHHRKRALSGFDAEIGMGLNKWCPMSWLNVYFAVGPYYYIGENGISSFAGGRARFSFDVKNFSFELKVTHDSHFGRICQGVLAWNFVYGQPYLPCKGCCWRDWLQAMMTLPVQRNEIIVLEKKHHTHSSKHHSHSSRCCSISNF